VTELQEEMRANVWEWWNEKPKAIQHNVSIYFELSRYYRKFKDIKTYDDV